MRERIEECRAELEFCLSEGDPDVEWAAWLHRWATGLVSVVEAAAVLPWFEIAATDPTTHAKLAEPFVALRVALEELGKEEK